MTHKPNFDNANAPRDSIGGTIRSLLGIIRQSGRRRQVLLLAVLIMAVILANAVGQVRLNMWQGAFFDALSRHDLPGFIKQLGVFVAVAGFLLVLGVAQTWLHAVLKTRMREIVARNVVCEWLKPKRAYWMPLAGEIGANPDQRIQDDARSLTDISTDFCVGLVQSSLLLFSFVGVLWTLSDEVVFSWHGSTFTIPGYMVWCALAYAAAGSWLTWLVGRPLAPLNAELRAKEADFRFTLVRANETSEGIALYRGEADEQRFIDGKLDALVAVMLRMANTYARLTWVTASYGWAAIVVPFIVTAPGYFSGTLTFGTLMMVAGAFTQVQQSLRWYVDNYANIAAWQAMSWRVLTYRNVLRRLETLGAGVGFAGRKHSSTDRFTVEDGFSVLAPSGRIAISEPGFSVGPGEHVLVTGPAGSGKSTYFRALAGLWPWGSGKAVLPPRDRVMFLPHFPYIPLGTLRDVLTYPTPGKFGDGAVRAALERLGLGHRADSLDEERRWDKELTLDEQQLVAFVRVLLHAPGLVIEDDAMSELDGNARETLQSVFAKELANTALISIGRDEFRDHFYQRRYRLSVQQPGIRLPLQLPD